MAAECAKRFQSLASLFAHLLDPTVEEDDKRWFTGCICCFRQIGDDQWSVTFAFCAGEAMRASALVDTQVAKAVLEKCDDVQKQPEFRWMVCCVDCELP
jgi:hypothetical protein